MRSALLFLAGAAVGFCLTPAVLAIEALVALYANDPTVGQWRSGWSVE